MIPIYRAKKIDGDRYIEGYFFKMWEKCYILWGTTNGVPNQTEIDPSTLAISFDGGENFDSFSFVARAIEDHREVTGIQQ